MPTTKKRINISVSDDLNSALLHLAKRDNVPRATKAEEMVRLGVDLEEDRVLEVFAAQRLKTSKKFISHEAVWKK